MPRYTGPRQDCVYRETSEKIERHLIQDEDKMTRIDSVREKGNALLLELIETAPMTTGNRNRCDKLVQIINDHVLTIFAEGVKSSD